MSQRAKKEVSDSRGLVDFAIGLVNSVFNLPELKLIPGGGGGLPWPIRVCAAEHGMVFRVLSLKQAIQFHY